MKVAALAVLLGFLAGAHAAPASPDLAKVGDTTVWKIIHAEAERIEKDGRPAVRLVAEGDSANGMVGLVLAQGLTFSAGSIAIDLKGKNLRQRSFLGVAFNVLNEKTFEAVYFRPFNFRADEPFRQRSVQYIAWPANTWEHLRKTSPGRFEQPVNPVPDPNGWFHARIDVTASQVRVFVNHAKEPSLVVDRLSIGGIERPVGLFVDSADGEYANLVVTPLP